MDFISSYIWVYLSFKIYIWNVISWHLTFFYSSIPHIKFPIHRICQNQKYWQFSQMTFAQLLWILPKTKMKINTNSIDDIFCVLIYFDTIILYMYLLSISLTKYQIIWRIALIYIIYAVYIMVCNLSLCVDLHFSHDAKVKDLWGKRDLHFPRRFFDHYQNFII